MFTSEHAITRRRFLAGIGVTAIAWPAIARAQTGKGEVVADGFRVVRARKGSALLRGKDQSPTFIWGYDGMVPGPTLRVKKGGEVKVRLVNELDEPTMVHWHGLRLTNAMDGTPLTQAPIAPGTSFDYRFVAPDAGTFWYHPHFNSSGQLGRGLYGALIVEEPEPVAIDRDLLLVLDDWRLTANGAIHESFGAPMDASHAGRLGQYLTVNGQDSLDFPVRTNERLRIRLINSANARVMRIRIDHHRPMVIALDGQPTEPFKAPDRTVTLGPGARADLLVDAGLKPGSRAPFVLEYGRGEELPFAHLVYEDGEPIRPEPPDAPRTLPPNALPERMDFAGALRMDVPIDGGAMSRMMMGDAIGINPRAGMFWSLAGHASMGHDGQPLLTVPRGRAVILTFSNRTAFPHAMHVHGHHFRVLEQRDDRWKPYWLDTVLLEPDETTRIAFVADNPGKWMLHCHMLEHQQSGMAAWFHVT